MARENGQKIKVRNVWASNLITECDHIKDYVESYSFASIRGKYLLHSTAKILREYTQTNPGVAYDFLKLQIGNHPMIQLGMTLFNSNQQLPLIEGNPSIWLFHFSMSDSHYCPKTLCEASLDVLDLHGVDFEVNQREGVDIEIFCDIMIHHGFLQKVRSWVSFTTLCDFGYLIKHFMSELNCYPETLKEFLEKKRSLLSDETYDVKDMANELVGRTRSLKEAAEAIGVDRVAESEEGNAGFDSHMVMQMFMSLKKQQELRDGIKSITDD